MAGDPCSSLYCVKCKSRCLSYASAGSGSAGRRSRPKRASLRKAACIFRTEKWQARRFLLLLLHLPLYCCCLPQINHPKSRTCHLWLQRGQADAPLCKCKYDLFTNRVRSDLSARADFYASSFSPQWWESAALSATCCSGGHDPRVKILKTFVRVSNFCNKAHQCIKSEEHFFRYMHVLYRMTTKKEGKITLTHWGVKQVFTQVVSEVLPSASHSGAIQQLKNWHSARKTGSRVAPTFYSSRTA